MKEIEEKKIKKVLTKRESMAIIYLVFSFEGAKIILDSSMAEHPAVNRRVAGSSPARGV